MKTAVKKSLIGILAMVILFVVGCTSGKDSNSGTAAPTAAPTAGASPAPADAKGEMYPENGLSKTEKVTIKWGFFEAGFGREWADNAVKKFTEKYPNVKFEITASPVIRDLIGIKMAANNDNDMFDIITPSFNGNAGSIATKAGKFEEMTDLWEREVPDVKGKKLKDVVIDNTMQFAAKVDGKYYELPLGVSALGLFFDKKLFEKNGWNQNPRSWGEFTKLLDDIKAKGITPITFPGVYPEYLTSGLKIKQFELAQQKGTLDQFVKDYRQGIAMYSASEYQEIWKRIYEMGKKGYFVEGAASLNHTQMQMQVLQHKAALTITGDWVENEMKDSTPDGFEWGFMTVPFVEKAGGTIWVESNIGNGAMMIWKNKPENVKKWAKEFNLFLMTNEIQAFNGKFGISPIRKDIAENPKNLEQLQSAPRAVFKYVLDNKATFGTSKRDVSFTHLDAARATKLEMEMIVDVAAGKKDPLPVLAEAQKLIDNAIAEEAKKK